MSTGIITVSSAYLSEDKCRQHNINIIDILLVCDDKIYEERKLNGKQFLELSEVSKHITTSQPTPQTFAKTFQKLESTYENVIVFILSKELSGTYNSCHIAKNDYQGNLNIEIIDTKTAALGIENIIDFTIENINQPFDILVEQIRKKVDDTKTFLTIDDLSVLVKSGKINALTSYIGNMLSLKLVLFLDNGVVKIFKKHRTRKKIYNTIYNELLNDYKVHNISKVYVAYTINAERAIEIKNDLKELMPNLKVIITQPIGPIFLHYIGSEGVGLSW